MSDTSSQKLLGLMATIIFICMAITSITAVYTFRIAGQSKQSNDNLEKLAESNQTFLTNLSDYFRCLVVPDEALYLELGKEAYFDRCDALLFRNTGLVPNPRPLTTTTTTIVVK